MANRTIQFCGYAYGDVPVQLNAHINGQTVFSGAVATLNEDPIFPPIWPTDLADVPVLFSVTESALFPTSFSGSYPMTVSVATGFGIVLGIVNSNYNSGLSHPVTFSGSISGTTLNVSGITSGEILSGMVIQGNGILDGTKIISGTGSTWQINDSHSQITSETTINGTIVVPANADNFFICYHGDPANSEGTHDSRSNVQINGVSITPDERTPTSLGNWPWLVTAGSTIEYNFNISAGSE